MSEPVLSEDARPADERTLPIIVYLLCLLVATPLLALILAYALKGRSVEPARSHYVFQIRTVWIWLAGMALSAVLMMFALPLMVLIIGVLFYPIAFSVVGLSYAWLYLRALVGLVYIARGQPYPRPDAWLI